MIKILLLHFLIISINLNAITFKNAIKILQKHESVESVNYKSKSTAYKAKLKGSWGDPIFKVMAKNFPKDNLKKNQTPMTAIEFSISQKIALTTKYGNIKSAFNSLAQAYKYEANAKKQALIRALWEILIIKRKISKELSILNENNLWIIKILKVSKRLYSTGKTSQQAILEIQIRKSEIESEISNKKFELSQINDRLIFLIGSSRINKNSIPWKTLNKSSKTKIDNKELSFKEKLKEKSFNLTASKLNYVPDLTISLGYAKRSNIDQKGDFLGASISFPLPFSGIKYSKHGKAIQEKYIIIKSYENYKKEKNRNISILTKEIKKVIHEINILKNKTIKFAQNSRKITSKSYSLGNSSYVELLQSELKLQKILIHKTMLEAKRDIKKATLKFIKGELLNE